MSSPTGGKKKDSGHEDKFRKNLRALRSAANIGAAVSSGSVERTAEHALMTGLKMASGATLTDPQASPLQILAELKKLGIAVLGWSPETLAATLDEKFIGWDKDRCAEAILHFHKTGVIKSDIPQLVREKIYAIRVVSTSNSAQTEWHIFEKVGGAFNGRTAKFGVVEPLTAGECARAVAVIENIRPDTYSEDVKVYIAVCCHQAGLLTVAPVAWLAQCEEYLQQLNKDATGESVSPPVRNAIIDEYKKITADPSQMREVPEEIVSVQAAKLAAINFYAEEIIRGS